MGRLKDYSKKNSKFLKLEDGESFIGTYLGYSMTFNKMSGKEVPIFKFKDEEGQEKFLQSQSGFLCHFFDEDSNESKVGDVIKITRIGTGMNTKYQAIVDNEIIP